MASQVEIPEDLVLASKCQGCGATKSLLGSGCKHMTLCMPCGKKMAKEKATCEFCKRPITQLIRRYPAKLCIPSEGKVHMAKFPVSVASCLTERNYDRKWVFQKEAGQAKKEIGPSKPPRTWILQDQDGKTRYRGQLENMPNNANFLLTRHGKDFTIIPIEAWYSFTKITDYKTLTLEEAEEKMKERNRARDGYARWMMKSAASRFAAFGQENMEDDSGKNKRRKSRDIMEDTDEYMADSDAEEKKEEEEGPDANADDQDQEGPADNVKGVDWEHEEVFSDDEELKLSDDYEDSEEEPSEAMKLLIDDEDNEHNELGEKLSQAGKELKELLEKVNNDKAAQENYGRNPKDKAENHGNIEKPTKANIKRKTAEKDPSHDVPPVAKKIKMKEENKMKMASTAGFVVKIAPSSSNHSSQSLEGGALTEEEIVNFLKQSGPIRIKDFVDAFGARTKRENKAAFNELLKKVACKKVEDGKNVIMLKTKFSG